MKESGFCVFFFFFGGGEGEGRGETSFVEELLVEFGFGWVEPLVGFVVLLGFG